MGSIGPHKPHILAFPYPGKGHINPMLHFCNSLTSMGIKITMIHTTSTIKSVKSNLNSSIRIEVISDGYEDIGDQITDIEVYFNLFKVAASRGLSQLIDKYIRLEEAPSIVVYDSTMPWALEVAHSHGVRGACFFTQSLSVSVLCYHMLVGTIEKDCDSTVIVPAMPAIEWKDLPDFRYVWDTKMAVRKHLLDQFSNIDKVDWILFNSFDELENEVAKWMARKWPVKTVGPTAFSMYTQKKIKTETENNVYLFETNSEACLEWLDTKETSSVIYVSFGSIASVGEEQMVEIARGLVKSGCDFLWVVRTEEQSKLPCDFISGKAGLVVNWCPQLDVLAHKAIACFMTHCGWNSTLEAVSLGVPMIALPQFVDQTTNAKFIADVWCTGVRGKINENGIVTSEEIEHCIVEIFMTENGKDMKRNAIKWKKMANEAVEGGSSARNIQDFVSELESIV